MMRQIFKGLRFPARVVLLSFLVILLVVAFRISLHDLSQQPWLEETHKLQRQILNHPRVLQPLLVRQSKVNATTKAIARELSAKFALNLGNELTVSEAWKVAADWFKPRELMPEQAPELGAILHRLSTSRIIGADVGYKGTQLKLSLILEGGQRVAFKPKWYERDYVILGKPYAGADRHNGEIASFHLNRILGFRRSPLVSGRVVNLRTEIMPHATPALLKTFFTRGRGNNTCFYGRCYYCKGPEDGVCAEGDLLEGAVVLWLPPDVKLKNHRHPWARTYKQGVLARWEEDKKYCDIVLRAWPYQKTSAEFLDLLDATIFDFLIGNADRHHYETVYDDELLSHRGLMLLLDNAKSFGNPFHDERSILAPILQCCRLRRSTYERLVPLRHGALGDVMENVMSRDKIQPILLELYYVALDRRLSIVLDVLDDCMTENGRDVVLVDDVRGR